ncbi:MAG: cohesin domain-containing protein, partial [Dehalococcoidia bacterium]
YCSGGRSTMSTVFWHGGRRGLRIGAFLFFAGAMAALSHSAGYAAGSAAYSLSPSDQTISPGGTASVQLLLTSASQVGGFSVDVTYDTKVVQADSCTAATAVGLISICNAAIPNSPGRVRFVGASATGVTGSVPVGTIAFHAVGAAGASTPLTIVVASSTDADGNDLSTTVTNGSITLAGSGNGSPVATASPGPGSSPVATASPASPASPAGVNISTGCQAVTVNVTAGSTTSDLVTMAQPDSNVQSVWLYDAALHVFRALYLALAGAPIDTVSVALGAQSIFFCVSGPVTIAPR